MIKGKPSVFIGTLEAPDKKPLEVIARELENYAQAPISTVPALRLQQHFSLMPWLIRQVLFQLAMLFPGLRLRLMPATFGVSSLGKYGMKYVTGPCASTSTFGVGVVEERVVARDGQITIRPMMSLTLASDLRVLDAGQAAAFLTEVQEFMEAGFEQELFEATVKGQGLLQAS